MSDADGLIVARGEQVYAVLNLYPYNSGHLMVVPYRHVADYTELTEAETAELADFTKRSMTALRDGSQAQGFNIGMNMGNVAGAGIAEHLHQHVVPRWGGDANFMPVVGRTKVLPQLLADTRVVLAQAWPGKTQNPLDPGNGVGFGRGRPIVRQPGGHGVNWLPHHAPTPAPRLQRRLRRQPARRLAQMIAHARAE